MSAQQFVLKKELNYIINAMQIDTEWKLKKPRFFALWRSCLPVDKHSPDTSVDKIWNTLTKKYTEAGRYYHSRQHILDCINQFDLVADKIDNPREVELSIWFHDIVYDSSSNDIDEIESAKLFAQLAEKAFPKETIKLVSDLIFATMHADDPKNSDEAFLVDIDLSSFGFPWERFTQDVTHLHMESPHLTKDKLNQATLKFYRHLQQKPRIFFTDAFYERYEDIARINIKRYINEIIKAA